MAPTPTPTAEQPQLDLARSTTHHPQHSGPPRAKLALLTWVGAYAVILGLLAIGGRTMGGWARPRRGPGGRGHVCRHDLDPRAGGDAAVPGLPAALGPPRPTSPANSSVAGPAPERVR